MNEQERTAFCSEPGEERRRSGAAARLFNEVQGKFGRLQPFDGLPNKAIIHIYKKHSMLKTINPKLPMRDKASTKEYYLDRLGFKELADYGDYLLLFKDNIEIHFFEFKELDPKQNYGQVYIRTNDIDSLYQELLENKVEIHPNGQLAIKAWGQKEFALLDPDNNLLTFGQSVEEGVEEGGRPQK